MDLYFNNLNSLPQQVEENRKNIKLLMQQTGHGSNFYYNSEVIPISAWVYEGNSWKCFINQPRMTDNSFSVITSNDDEILKLYDFSKIYKVNSKKEGLEIFARSKPANNIYVTVWYTIHTED